MLESSVLLGNWPHLKESLLGTYMESVVRYWFVEMRRNYIHTGWNGFLVIVNLKLIRIYFYKVLYHGGLM